MSMTPFRSNLSRSLGAAFLLQALASLVSGGFLFNPLIVEEDIRKTMLNLASHAPLVHASIIGDIVTAAGIIFLGAILFAVVGSQNKGMALTALGLYIFEAGILVASKCVVFGLLKISQDYAATGDKAIERLARLALEAEHFMYTLHMLPFGLGAILFYFLLNKSNLIPKWLSLWGLIAVPFVLVGAVWTISDAHVPPAILVLALPYVPFEFFAGLFILVRGFHMPIRKDLIQ
ncbi:DUF4386 domain-containing protein [Gorillibacterium massiliense]|uniref:DUF4386 domain-containing protein n=1 Tax=Gorillibacterium massiliense TaxID=1280390 RepID=UPI000595355E|nr:DUF4386 domain-containing protein [Gorillibacterium massiliense]